MKTFWNQDVYIKAYRYAALAHQGQQVPGTPFPYLAHVSLVSMEVIAALGIEEFNDGDLAIQCALLHDVIEDTDITYEEIEKEFGKEVADGVLALTKDENLPKERQMFDSLERIQQQPDEIWAVKLADRITNLQPPPASWSAEKKEAYKLQAIEIYEALKEASPFLAERLQHKIENY